jgi:hypothetical protein
MDHMGESLEYLDETRSHYHLNENQLYLGTRYTGLLAFVFFFINIDSTRAPCQVRRFTVI